MAAFSKYVYITRHRAITHRLHVNGNRVDPAVLTKMRSAQLLGKIHFPRGR